MVVEHVTEATLGVLVVYDEHESRSSIKPDMSRFLLRYSKARVRVESRKRLFKLQECWLDARLGWNFLTHLEI